MRLSSVSFTHFTFTPSLRKLMTFIILLSSFPSNIPYMTLVLMTFHTTDGLLDMYLKNPEELFTICVELCPFFPKCLTLSNTKILPLAYKHCITLFTTLCWCWESHFEMSNSSHLHYKDFKFSIQVSDFYLQRWNKGWYNAQQHLQTWKDLRISYPLYGIKVKRQNVILHKMHILFYLQTKNKNDWIF